MARPSVVSTQTDFSAGEVDESLMRADASPVLKTGARQMLNWRQLNTGKLKNRPGRSILFSDGFATRVDEVIMPGGQLFRLLFSAQTVRVRNAAGALVFDSGTIFAWIARLIVWDVSGFSVFMTCDAGGFQPPQVLTWDGVSQTSTWTLVQYAEDVVGAPNSFQKRTPFYRLSPRGIKVQPTAQFGSINLAFSAPVLTASHAGTRIRYVGRQIQITSVNSPILAAATVLERLFPTQQLQTTLGSVPADFFSIDDVVVGQTSNARGIVISLFPTAMQVQLLQADGFIASEIVGGQNGTLNFNNTTPPDLVGPAGSVTFWDDEVMNTSLRGYPASVFSDQGRIGFCDFPSLPGLVVWSALNNPYDLYSDENNANPTNAIIETVPSQARVLFVVPGMDSSEFVFCDNAIYAVPITQANPLQPGSVAFNELSSDGSAQVKPRRAGASIVYVGTGARQIKAIQAIGAFSRPYIVDDVTELRSHLIEDPFALAIQTSSDQYEEEYIYLLNDAGLEIVVGKYSIKNGMIDTANIGWLPWTGGASGHTAQWISALNGNVLVTGIYVPNAIPNVNVTEQIDADQYLDAAMLYNAVPAPLPPPVGKGPLWWLAGGSVDLMDGTRMMGTYIVDADGFLVPKNNAGEDFTSATLAVGQTWTATLEPFVPPVPGGQDIQQRLRPRRVKRAQVYVQESSGFVLARLFSGVQTPTSPLPGTVMAIRRIPTWNLGEDPTQPPKLREQSYMFRPRGNTYDPRWAVLKDTPGPITILETTAEATV